MKKIIYTAITGDYDKLIEQPKQEGWDYICFTDNPDLKSDLWDIRVVEWNEKKCREIKILPHKFLPEHALSIWLDGNLKINCNPDKFLTMDYCVMHHPWRKNISEEAENCVWLQKDNSDIIMKQVSDYKAELGDFQGLFATGVIIRKNTEENQKFSEFWWNEVEKYSRRDQISFAYCIEKYKFECKTFKFLEGFMRMEHKPKYQFITACSDKIKLENLLKSRVFRTQPLKVIENYHNICNAYNQSGTFKTHKIYINPNVILLNDFEIWLEKGIDKVNEINPGWGVIGFTGAVPNGENSEIYGNFTDTSKLLAPAPPYPFQVQTVADYLFITKDSWGFDEQIPGDYFYAADICLQTAAFGMRNYIIELPEITIKHEQAFDLREIENCKEYLRKKRWTKTIAFCDII